MIYNLSGDFDIMSVIIHTITFLHYPIQLFH